MIRKRRSARLALAVGFIFAAATCGAAGVVEPTSLQREFAKCLNERGSPAGCGGLPAGGSTRELTPAEQQEDFDEAVRLLLEVEVAPFMHVTSAAFESRRRELRARLDVPRTPAEFWREAVGPLFAALGNAHDAARYLAGYEAYAAQGGPLMPLDLRCLDQRAFVVADHRTEPQLRPGTEVLAIDGQPLSAIIESLVPAVGGENAAIRQSTVCVLLRPFLFNLVEPAAAWRLTVRRAPGQAAEDVQVAGIDRPTLRAQAARATAASLRLQFIEPGPLAVLRIDSLSGEAAFQAFIAQSFAEIRQRGARGVIVDLRRNSGGASRLNELWLGKLTQRPFTQYGATVTRTSRAVKQALGRDRYIAVYGEEAWASPDGALLREAPDEFERFVPSEGEADRFAGPWVLLVGPSTYSSASAGAAAVKSFGLAPIVGEETGGTWPAGGEPLRAALPHSGIELQIAAKLFEGPPGLPAGRGVQPDVLVRTTADDWAAGRDPVLDAAVRLIRQRAGISERPSLEPPEQPSTSQAGS